MNVDISYETNWRTRAYAGIRDELHKLEAGDFIYESHIYVHSYLSVL